MSGQHSTHTFKRLTQPAENRLLPGGQEQHRAHSNSVKENFLYHFQSSSSHCKSFQSQDKHTRDCRSRRDSVLLNPPAEERVVTS